MKKIALILCLLLGLVARAQTLNVAEPADLRQLSDVSTFYINTEGGRSVSSKSTFIWARLWEVTNGEVTLYDSLRIRGRGNSTWGLGKKPYRLKFLNKERLLGKGRANAKNWVLMANHADKTLLRNTVAACIGTSFGQPFTAGARFVDLVLNGQYIGCYQVSDFVDIRKHRVDIVEQAEELEPGADISGGYLFEADGFASGEQGYWRTQRGVPMAVKSPDAEVITKEQANYLHAFMDDFESRLFSSNFKDAQAGYRAVVDSLTLASWFLGTEFTANSDGYWSVYLYKEQQDPLLYWGPMWDYDIAFCNDSRVSGSTQQLMLQNGHGGGVVQPWIRQMWTDPWFKNLTARIWQEARTAGILERTLQQVDSLAEVINQSQALNFSIYPINQRVYDEVQVFSSYQEGVNYLKRFLQNHAAYLDGVFQTVPPTPEPNPEPEPEPNPEPNPGEDPDGEYFIPSSRYRYFIHNAGTDNRVDIEDNRICTWEPTPERLGTQIWNLTTVGTSGAVQILTPDSLQAMVDVAQQMGSTFEKSVQISLTAADSTDLRQQWYIVRTANNWSIVNAYTGNAWNNSGGHSTNGNPVISWTNDSQNSTKLTRQWYFAVAEEIIPPTPEPEPEPEPNPTPKDGAAYYVRHLDSGFYLNLVRDDLKCTILGREPEALYFTPTDEEEAAFYVTNAEGLYMGKGATSWNMSSSVPEVWTIEKTPEGVALHSATGGSAGYLGFDRIDEGAPAYRDKDYERYHGLFALEPVDEPEPGPGPTLSTDRIEVDYIISYNPQLQRISVLSAEADAAHLSGWMEVRSLSGQMLLHQAGLQPMSLAHLPRATYVLRWCVNGQVRSRKLAL